MTNVQILVVDDYIPNIELLSSMLAKFDVTILTATSGYQAIEIITNESIDVALLDVCLPDLNGFELAEHLRKSEKNKYASIIFITAVNIDQKDRLLAYKLGAIDYIQKPIDIETLDAKISVYIQLAKQESKLIEKNKALQNEISLRVEMESKLRYNEEMFRLSLDTLGEGVWDFEVSTGKTQYSLTWLNNVGCSDTKVQTLDIYYEIIHPQDIESWKKAFSAFITNKTPIYEHQHRVLMPDGSYDYFLDRVVKVSCTPAGEALRVLGVSSNITEKKLATDKVELAAAVFEHGAEAVIITDNEANIIRTNKAFTKITGYEESEVIGKNPSILSSGKHDPDFYKNMWLEISKYGKWQGEIWNRRKNGSIFPEWEIITAIRTETGELKNYIATFSDISNKKKQEGESYYLSNYDALTSFPNRNLFKQLISSETRKCHKNNTACALLVIDIDDFKSLNDSLGHEIGDIILQTVASKIKAVVTHSNVAGHIGGDEFLMLLTNLSGNQNNITQSVSDSAINILQEFDSPFLVQDIEVKLSISIGIALYPFDSDDNSELLKMADTALFKVKGAGKNNFIFCSQNMIEQPHKRME